MIPEIDRILRTSATQILSDLVPRLPEQHLQGEASLIAFMLMFSATEYDRAADIRAAENADIRALFAALAPRVRDDALRSELHAVATAREDSLAVSALNRSNHALRRLLIRLHEHLEDDPAADAKIWSLLKAMATRRLLPPPGG